MHSKNRNVNICRRVLHSLHVELCLCSCSVFKCIGCVKAQPQQAAVPGASNDSPMIMTTAVKMLPILRPMRSMAKPSDTIPAKRPATCNTKMQVSWHVRWPDRNTACKRVLLPALHNPFESKGAMRCSHHLLRPQMLKVQLPERRLHDSLCTASCRGAWTISESVCSGEHACSIH